jgi:hypothetical protein
MNDTMRITDVFQRLQAILEVHGNLEVYSVNYHSDFEPVPLTFNDIKEQIKVDYGVCLIYGGSR